MQKIKKHRNLAELLIVIFSLILFFVGNIIDNFNMILCSILIVLINNVCFSIFDIKRNIVFIIFNITFFTLLLGKYFFGMISNEIWYNKFDEDIQKNTLLLLYISLVSILVGNKLYGIYQMMVHKYKKNIVKEEKKINETKIKYIRTFLLISFLITLIPAIIETIEKIIFVYQNSYIGLHSEFKSQIPFIIQKLADTNFTFFVLYLSTFPDKKQVISVTIAYICYLILTIFTGGRGEFVLGVILIFIYFIYRQYTFDEKYINMKRAMILIIITIIMITFLGAYNVLRNRKTIENFNPIKQFIQFFIDQSNSVDIISYAQKYEEMLPSDNNNYTFGIIINKLLNRDEYILETNTEKTALYGNNLGATLSYLTMKNSFLKGHGLGTQYIAELYIDFSYVGVIMYNVILGYVLIGLINIKRENYIMFSLGLAIIYNLIYLPRQFAMTWLGYLLSSTVIAVYVLIFIIDRIIERRKKNEVIVDS